MSVYIDSVALLGQLRTTSFCVGLVARRSKFGELCWPLFDAFKVVIDLEAGDFAVLASGLRGFGAQTGLKSDLGLGLGHGKHQPRKKGRSFR